MTKEKIREEIRNQLKDRVTPISSAACLSEAPLEFQEVGRLLIQEMVETGELVRTTFRLPARISNDRFCNGVAHCYLLKE